MIWLSSLASSEQDEAFFRLLCEQQVITHLSRVYPQEEGVNALTVSLQATSVDLEKALRWIKKKLDACGYPGREIGGVYAYRVLLSLHDASREQAGHPESRQCRLPF